MKIETLHLIIREIKETDFDLYAQLAREHRLFRRFFSGSPEETKNSYWKMITEGGGEYFSAFIKKEKDEPEFIGSLHINETEEGLKYEINILAKYQGYKYGPEATKVFMEWLAIERDIHHFILEISANNRHAISMFESLGAVEHISLNDNSDILRKMVKDEADNKSSAKYMKKYDLNW